MLANILAIVVGIGSLYLLSTAFIAADSHRKDDFLWGAVGLFYALVLWVCAGRFTGAILLGQAAASVLLLTFGWQTLQLRQALLYPDKPLQLFSVVGWVQGRVGKVTPLKMPKTPAGGAKDSPIDKISRQVKETVAPIPEKVSAAVTDTVKSATAAVENTIEAIDDIFDDFDDEPEIDEVAPIPEKVSAAVTETATEVAEEIDDILDDFDDEPEIDDNVTETGKLTPIIEEDATVTPAVIPSEPIIPTLESPTEELPEIIATLDEESVETDIPTEVGAESSEKPYQN
jgi:hypothetical protein